MMPVALELVAIGPNCIRYLVAWHSRDKFTDDCLEALASLRIIYYRQPKDM